MKLTNDNEKTENQKTPYIVRNYKDRLFRFIFQDKERLLELYNALNHSGYKNPDDLVINTLDDVIYMGMKNDISFLIGGTLNLYEHQSTYNPNMPLRGLLYFSRIYSNYIKSNELNLCSRTQVALPAPVYLIFYNGTDSEPDRKELSLSNAFQHTGTDFIPCLECKAQLININYGHNQELMHNCKTLNEYALFISKIREQMNEGNELETAVARTVDECIQNGILKEILMKNRNEVIDMVLTSFNQELHDKQEREAAYHEGWAAGAKAEQLQLIKKKLARGKSISEIADALEEPESVIEELIAHMQS